MKLANLITVRMITPGVMLACLALTSPICGFDTRFASGKSALAIPFELDNDVIYLRVSVNDSSPLSFILDTGAGYTILSLQNAKSFGMRLQLAGKVEVALGLNLRMLTSLQTKCHSACRESYSPTRAWWQSH